MNSFNLDDIKEENENLEEIEKNRFYDPDEEEPPEKPGFSDQQKKILIILVCTVAALALITGFLSNRYSRKKYSPETEPETRVTETTTVTETKAALLCKNGHEYKNGATCGCSICIKEYGKDDNCQLVAEYKSITIICPMCHKTQTFSNTVVASEKCNKCNTVVENEDKLKNYHVKCGGCGANLQICQESQGLKQTNVKINKVYWPASEVYDLIGPCKKVTYEGITYFYYPDEKMTPTEVCSAGDAITPQSMYALYLYNGNKLTSVSGAAGVPYYVPDSGKFYLAEGKEERMYNPDGKQLQKVNHTNCNKTEESTEK